MFGLKKKPPPTAPLPGQGGYAANLPQAPATPAKKLKPVKVSMPSRPGELVLKLAPQSWMLAEVLDDKGKVYVKHMATHFLPRPVDPNNPNPDLEILQEVLQAFVAREGLIGRDVTVVLPSSGALTRSFEVPFDLTKKADIKEFNANLPAKDFWQEFEADVQDIKFPVFRSQYLAPGDEEGSSKVVFSYADQMLLNKFIDLCLSAQLYPVALVPETLAIMNLLVPQVDRLEREGYFGLLHIARGRSQLLAVGPERLAAAKVNILELDEELLDEIEAVDDISGEFWEEVGDRLSSALRQAVMYLREQEHIPPFKNIYVICEAPKSDNTLALVKSKFNLGSLKGWNPLNFVTVQPSTLHVLADVPNQAAWASLLGAGLLGLRPSKLFVEDVETPKFQINLHPQSDKLYTNRKYRRVAKAANWAGVGFASVLAVWFALDLGPRYLRLDREVKSFAQVTTDVQQATGQLSALDGQLNAKRAELQRYLSVSQSPGHERLLLRLPGVLPTGTELSSLELKDKMVMVKGHANDPVAPQVFLQNLISSKVMLDPVLSVQQGTKGLLLFTVQGSVGSL